MRGTVDEYTHFNIKINIPDKLIVIGFISEGWLGWGWG